MTSCNHNPRETYLVRPVAIVENIVRVEEVSLVARPKQPDARLASVPISTKALAKTLGPGFSPGMDDLV